MGTILYTAKQVLELLGIKSYQTLTNWKKKGYLKPLNLPSRRVYYSKEEIQRFLKNGVYEVVENDDEELISHE